MRIWVCIFAWLLYCTASIGQGATPSSFRQLADLSIDSRIGTNEHFDAECLSRFLNYPPDAVRADTPFLVGLAEDMGLLSTPFKPNPKFWLKEVDFSCASPWNSGGGRVRAGTAISPRHIIFAKHFPLWPDVRIVFVGADGTPTAYYIEKTKALKACDIMIGSLNAELTPDIHPAKIMPLDYTNHLGRAEGLPVVALTQFEKASLGELLPLLTNSVYDLISYTHPKAARRRPYKVKISVGDSGGPVFLVLGNEPVLMFCHTTSMGGYGVHYFRREIQAAMDELCPGYKLEEFNFGGIQSTTAQGNP